MTNTATPAFDLLAPVSGEGLTHLHAENTTGILCGSTRRYSTFTVMGIVPAGAATCEACNRAAARLERDAEVRAGYNATGPCGVGSPATLPNADSCWVCSYGPHADTDHTYTTEAEALAWHAAQPQGEPVWPVIDGEPLGGFR